MPQRNLSMLVVLAVALAASASPAFLTPADLAASRATNGRHVARGDAVPDARPYTPAAVDTVKSPAAHARALTPIVAIHHEAGDAHRHEHHHARDYDAEVEHADNDETMPAAGVHPAEFAARDEDRSKHHSAHRKPTTPAQSITHDAAKVEHAGKGEKAPKVPRDEEGKKHHAAHPATPEHAIAHDATKAEHTSKLGKDMKAVKAPRDEEGGSRLAARPTAPERGSTNAEHRPVLRNGVKMPRDEEALGVAVGAGLFLGSGDEYEPEHGGYQHDQQHHRGHERFQRDAEDAEASGRGDHKSKGEVHEHEHGGSEHYRGYEHGSEGAARPKHFHDGQESESESGDGMGVAAGLGLSLDTISHGDENWQGEKDY
ncbi:hypothetical protein HWV62_2966 [Athelia sp. TMB]|nr:hypothetical protein HWV62_2966 [Athelia sp. TMB]